MTAPSLLSAAVTTPKKPGNTIICGQNIYKNPVTRGFPKQIFIRCHGKQLELGSFLNKKDKETLIKDLKHIVYA